MANNYISRSYRLVPARNVRKEKKYPRVTYCIANVINHKAPSLNVRCLLARMLSSQEWGEIRLVRLPQRDDFELNSGVRRPYALDKPRALFDLAGCQRTKRMLSHCLSPYKRQRYGNLFC